MTMMTRRMAGAALLPSCSPTSVALAQAQRRDSPVRVRGTIESVDGQMLTIKATDGATMKVKLADNATCSQQS